MASARVAAAGDWVQWPGNGHSYTVVLEPLGISWSDANVAAQALGGQLASITSVEESAFVFNLIDDPQYWRSHVSFTDVEFNIGPWIGGFQPAESEEPSSGWQWTTGEPFEFTAWFEGEPNESPIPGEATENRICFWVRESLTDRSAQWNDFHDGGCWEEDCVVAFVVERSCNLLTIDGPTAQTVCAGGSAVFMVTPTGVEPFTYAWHKGGQPLTDGPTITGSDAPTLTLTGLTLLQGDDYTCIVSDACGPVVSAAATLTVIASGTGDGDASGAVDGLDIAGFVTACTQESAASPAYCAFDMNVDGTVDADDLDAFLALLIAE